MNRVIITGAASGIGKALAFEYWHRGCEVHLLDRDAVALDAVKESLPDRCFCYTVDLLDEQQLNDFCDKWQQPIWRLINNAGITHRSPASETQLSVFNRVMDLNWKVPVALTRGLMDYLKGGKVINLSSMAALMPVPGRAAYCASKSALTQHFECWRPELQLRDIDLLMVYPSFVATNIDKNALGADGKNAQHAQSKVGKTTTVSQMAKRICLADDARKSRFKDSAIAPRFGLWLWQNWPSLYERLCWRQFQGELT